MMEYLDLLLWPVVATNVLTWMHVYLGLQVGTRG